MKSKKSSNTKRITDAGANFGRRRLLGSLAGGGAVGAFLIGGLPEKWVKPVINSVVAPAHAQTSVILDLTCEVETFSLESGFGVFTPAAGPVSGGDTVDFDSSFPNAVSVTLSGISATLSPTPLPVGEQVSLSIDVTNTTTDAVMADPSPAPVTPDGSGVAVFPDIDIDFNQTDVAPASGTVDLVFSAPSATSDCTISFTFTEDENLPPPP